MVKTARNNPAVFFATCARLIGPEIKLTIEQNLPGNLSPRRLEYDDAGLGRREISDTGCSK
jgi:hypothetical protein